MTNTNQPLMPKQTLENILRGLVEEAREAAASAAYNAKSDSRDRISTTSANLVQILTLQEAVLNLYEHHDAKQEYIDKLVIRTSALEDESEDWREEAKRAASERDTWKANYEAEHHSCNERYNQTLKAIDTIKELHEKLAQLEAENEELRKARLVADAVAVDEVDRQKKVEAYLEYHKLAKYYAYEEADKLDLAAAAAASLAAEDWHEGTVDAESLEDIYETAYRDGWQECRRYHNIQAKAEE